MPGSPDPSCDLLVLSQSGPELPSVRFRMLPLMALADQAGWRVRHQVYPRSFLARCRLLPFLPRSRIVLLQKKLAGPAELAWLRRRGQRLVFDVDDAIWTTHSQAITRPAIQARNARRFAATMQQSDLVVAGNSYLEAEARRQGARATAVMPTPIDTTRYTPDQRPASRRPVLGWMGTRANLGFLAGILPVLAPLAGQCELLVVSDGQFPILPPWQGRHVTWSGEQEISLLRSMDLGLMPLTDDVYTRGKCGFKILQYLACGCVPIASAVGFNREILTDGIDGLLVGRSSDWLPQVGRALQDPAWRRCLAEAGRRRVEQAFSWTVLGPAWLRLLSGEGAPSGVGEE